MILSSLIGSGAKPYLEYGWVTAPNTAGQSFTANTITTLTIDTEVADTGNFGSIASNQITLAAGTYYFKAFVNSHTTTSYVGGVASLYNITNSTYVSRSGALSNSGNGSVTCFSFDGQFVVSAATNTFSLLMVTNGAVFVDNCVYSTTFSTITASGVAAAALTGADQRTTLKLWKLA